MTTDIVSIAGGLTAAEVNAAVASPSEEWSVRAHRTVYYPYLWSRLRYATRTLLGTSGVQLSCLVDLRTGVPSTTDPFDLTRIETETGAVMAPRLDEGAALRIARRYGAHAAPGRRTALMAPSVTVLDQRLVYKPFWIVDGTDRGGSAFRILVDGISGRVHPLAA